MSNKDFNSTLLSLLSEISESNKGASAAIAGSIQRSISADIPPIVLPDAVVQLMELGVISSKVAFTQEDLSAILKSVADILLAVKLTADEGATEPDYSLSEIVGHFQQKLALLTNADLLSYDLKDPFVALDSDAERYALAQVLDDMATDRKIQNKPYLWRTILDSRGKM